MEAAPGYLDDESTGCLDRLSYLMPFATDAPFVGPTRNLIRREKPMSIKPQTPGGCITSPCGSAMSRELGDSIRKLSGSQCCLIVPTSSSLQQVGRHLASGSGGGYATRRPLQPVSSRP